MLLTLKTLQQQTFKIEIDEKELVRYKIHIEKGAEWELSMFRDICSYSTFFLVELKIACIYVCSYSVSHPPIHS